MFKLYLICLLFLTADFAYAQDLQQIRKELLAIHKEDQLIRHELIAAMEHPNSAGKTIDSLRKIMLAKDSLNLIRVTKILDSYGWLGKDKIGETANGTLFLVVQHSNLKTQQKYLPMVRQAVLNGDASKSELALLEDRVAILGGRMQTYGSQIGQFPYSKKYYVMPLIEPESVDIRRAEMGLQPLADYVKQWKIVWDPKEYAKQLPVFKKLNRIK